MEIIMKDKKPFKVGATYELLQLGVDSFWFTSPARDYCNTTFGVAKHVFTGKCVDVDGGAYLELPNGDIVLVLSSERKLFKRIDNK